MPTTVPHSTKGATMSEPKSKSQAKRLAVQRASERTSGRLREYLEDTGVPRPGGMRLVDEVAALEQENENLRVSLADEVELCEKADAEVERLREEIREIGRALDNYLRRGSPGARDALVEALAHALALHETETDRL